MKVLCLFWFLLLAASQGFNERSIVERSALSQVQHFLRSSMRVVANGCQKVTKYVTGAVCTSLNIVPKTIVSSSCLVYTVGAATCAGVVEGAEKYCSAFGLSLPGGPAADKIICDAIQRHG